MQSSQPVGTIITSILQMKKQRLGETKPPPQQSASRARIQKQAVCFHSPSSQPLGRRKDGEEGEKAEGRRFPQGLRREHLTAPLSMGPSQARQLPGPWEATRTFMRILKYLWNTGKLTILDLNRKTETAGLRYDSCLVWRSR